MRSITVKKNDAGQRLDKFLSKAVKGLPTSMMYKLIRTKKIKVNRKRTEQSYVLQEGDEILLFIRDEFFDSPQKDRGALDHIVPKLNIVYEDDNLLLLNKRPGVLVHEDTAANENTLILHVWAYLYQKGEYDPRDEQSFAPALCNRIDRNTGGIVIAAKNAQTLRCVNEKIRENQIDKFYLCLVHGHPKPPKATLTAYLRKDSANNRVEVRAKPFPAAKEIVTGYETLEHRGDQALLRIHLITGRTHQIRAHMAFLGHPLLGDGKYGVNREERTDGYKHQALYAYRLFFKPTEQQNPLSYLEGRAFELDRSEIWFLQKPDSSKSTKR